MSGSWTSRLVRALAVIGLAAAAISGCAGGPAPSDTLALAIPAGVDTLDPARGHDTYSVAVIHAVAGCLLDYDEGTGLRPDLALSWSVSDDRRRYAFSLRPGIRFSNGRPVTAADFKYSLERVLDPRTQSPGAALFELLEGAAAYRQGKRAEVSGIQAPDESHLVLVLREPAATLPYSLATTFAAPVAREAVEKQGPLFGSHPVAAGSYQLDRWEPGRYLELSRLAAEPSCPERIHVDLSVPETIQMARFGSGALDVTSGVPLADLPRLLADPEKKTQLATAVVDQTWYVGMNTRMKPFDDVRVRRAVNYAVDREKQARIAGDGEAAYAILPPPMPGYDGAYKPYPRDPRQARDLLRQAGHPDGITATMWIVAQELWRRRAAGLAADLSEAGIRLEIREAEPAEYSRACSRDQGAQCWYGGWYPAYPDPSGFLDDCFHSRKITPVESRSAARYFNPRVDLLLDRGRGMALGPERLQVYREAERLVMRDAPWAPLYHELEARMHQPNIGGAQPHPVWRYLRFAAVTKTAARP